MAGPTTRALLLRTALDGDRAALAALPRLAATRREASRVSELLGGGRLLVGPAASEDTLAALSRRDGLARFAVLHFATHALVDSDDPDRSALVLAQTGQTESTGDGGAHDGLLTVREIERGWRLDADLVTLSACETGLGRRVDGEGYLGLAHALLGAGAHSVLASLWKVDDAATALLMQRFYENWTGAHPDPRAGFAPAAPLPKARALREAKAWLRDWRDSSGQAPYAHPAYGAGFVLVGSPN
jgi:CHAT domain-containing protein